jgi:hypothetical protein
MPERPGEAALSYWVASPAAACTVTAHPSSLQKGRGRVLYQMPFANLAAGTHREPFYLNICSGNLVAGSWNGCKIGLFSL